MRWKKNNDMALAAAGADIHRRRMLLSRRRFLRVGKTIFEGVKDIILYDAGVDDGLKNEWIK